MYNCFLLALAKVLIQCSITIAFWSFKSLRKKFCRKYWKIPLSCIRVCIYQPIRRIIFGGGLWRGRSRGWKRSAKKGMLWYGCFEILLSRSIRGLCEGSLSWDQTPTLPPWATTSCWQQWERSWSSLLLAWWHAFQLFRQFWQFQEFLRLGVQAR